MKAVSKILAGGIGLAALASAAPAAAQYYPTPGYGNNNVVGQVLGQILNPQGAYNNGYSGNYAQNDRYLVDRCAAAVQQRVGGQYGGYQQYGQPYGYNNGYAYGNARVLGITSVERRNSGLRVRGVATTGAGYNGQYGYNGRVPPEDAENVRLMQQLEIGAGIAFWSIYSWSVVDSLLHYKPRAQVEGDDSLMPEELRDLESDQKAKSEKSEKAKAKSRKSPSPRSWLGPAPAPGGVVLGLGGEF